MTGPGSPLCVTQGLPDIDEIPPTQPCMNNRGKDNRWSVTFTYRFNEIHELYHSYFKVLTKLTKDPLIPVSTFSSFINVLVSIFHQHSLRGPGRQYLCVLNYLHSSYLVPIHFFTSVENY